MVADAGETGYGGDGEPSARCVVVLRPVMGVLACLLIDGADAGGGGPRGYVMLPNYGMK